MVTDGMRRPVESVLEVKRYRYIDDVGKDEMGVDEESRAVLILYKSGT
jgi:hypothetical protein